MSQSLSKIFVHIVFHVKNNRIKIRSQEEKELYAYMGAIISDNDSVPIIINGMPDHIHLLCIMSKKITLAKLVEEIKKHSSRWIKTKHDHYKYFRWQGAYGAFSVTPEDVPIKKKYIERQKEHHKKADFINEYLHLLNKNGLDYDEKYLWTD